MSNENEMLICFKLVYVAFRELIEARNLELKMLSHTQALVSAPKPQASLPVEDVNIELEETILGIEDDHSSRGSSDGVESSSQGNLARNTEQHVSRTHASQMRQHPWTRVHSYFALMGGYVFEFTKEEQTTLGIRDQRLTLNPIALRTLAEHAPELLPDISKASILDKSKANSLAKFLVCAQATWFLVQIIGRLAARLPITLLELNTGLHALCSLFIYLAWWQKPLDIEEPHTIKITGDLTLKICA
jgi:hypothetical protein